MTFLISDENSLTEPRTGHRSLENLRLQFISTSSRVSARAFISKPSLSSSRSQLRSDPHLSSEDYSADGTMEALRLGRSRYYLPIEKPILTQATHLKTNKAYRFTRSTSTSFSGLGNSCFLNLGWCECRLPA